MSGQRGRGCGAGAAQAPSGRLNMMFSTIDICKLSTSALCSDSDHVFPPLSTKILTILLILTPGFNVHNFHFHAFLMCPLVPYMTYR